MHLTVIKVITHWASSSAMEQRSRDVVAFSAWKLETVDRSRHSNKT